MGKKTRTRFLTHRRRRRRRRGQLDIDRAA